jgi:hypothetical protein
MEMDMGVLDVEVLDTVIGFLVVLVRKSGVLRIGDSGVRPFVVDVVFCCGSKV